MAISHPSADHHLCEPRSSHATGRRRKLPAVAVRSFLRFLVFRGEIQPGLEAAAPLPPQWKQSALPPRLAPEEMERVLAVYQDGNARGPRDRAILFLLARLGLRAQDVALMCLDDIDWGDGRLDLRPGKSRRARSLPLPQDVGRALVTYLQTGRPQTAKPPSLSAKSATVSSVDHEWHLVGGAASVCAGRHRRPPGIACHIFRHTAASDMVNRGASFKEVADVLGHQSIATTGIYAKLDLHALAAVALPWGGEAQ